MYYLLVKEYITNSISNWKKKTPFKHLVGIKTNKLSSI